MAMDFHARRDRLAELLASEDASAASTDANAFLRACISAGHRKHFFVAHPDGAVLHRRGQTIFDAIETHCLVGARAKAGKDQWQAFCEGRDPLSLSAILKIDDALKAFSEAGDEAVRALTHVRQEPFKLQPSTIVPSIYYAQPNKLLEYRIECVQNRDLPKQREKLSQRIFGPLHMRTLEVLEYGDTTGRHARVTWGTVKKLSAVLGSEIEDLFTEDPGAGPRNGEQTFALHPRQGNSIDLPDPPVREAVA